jgi:hypothetical protein
MMRTSLKFAFAAAVLACAPTAIAQQTRVEVGIIDCRGTTAAFVVGSVTEMNCVFRSGNETEPYSGTMRRAGLDLGINQQIAVAWAVFAPTRQIGRGELAGTYVGASASATVGVGVGANALIGGSNNTIAFQPVSVQGQTGFNAALGVAGLELRPAR